MISSWLLGRGPACIVKPYSEDLRERAVTEVEGGLFRQQAAALFDLRRQDFIEAPNVGILRRGDEVAIERGEFVDVVGLCFS
jgi:hypothetical protein